LKLNALLDVSLAINNNVSKRDLYAIYEDTLKKLNIEKLALFIFDEQWKLTLKYGLKNNEVAIDVSNELLHFTQISEVNFKDNPSLKSFDLVVPVYHQTKAIAFLLIGDLVNEAIKISPIIKHLNFIQTFTN